MKKTITIFALALAIAGSALAHGDAKEKANNLSVMNMSNNIVKVFYAEKSIGKVSIAIKNKDGITVLRDKISNQNGFARPYNFSGMDEGTYTIELKDGNETIKKEIIYAHRQFVTARKLADGKFKLIVEQDTKSPISVKIYDEDGQKVHRENHKLGFARVYDLSKITSDYLTFEVVTKTGSQSVSLKN